MNKLLELLTLALPYVEEGEEYNAPHKRGLAEKIRAAIEEGASEVKSQEPAPYLAHSEDHIIAQALAILERRNHRPIKAGNPKDVGNFFALRSANLEHEVFSVAYLDAQNRIIAIEELSRGTINQAAVYPREVVKSALKHNAASVILHHNHPSGVPEPSRADEVLTKKLQNSLELVDIRVLDHVITGGEKWVSMAEMGLV